MPDRTLFDAGAALGFPRLPIRPAVSVIAGREAWERFTANGTEEDVAAARIAVAACLEKAQRDSLTGAGTGAAPSACPAAEKAQRRDGCAFCGGSLVGRRPHARYCGGRCRAAASDARRVVPDELSRRRENLSFAHLVGAAQGGSR